MKKFVHYLTFSVIQVYISYIDQLSTTEERREQLESQYYFTCDCVMCTDTELVSGNSSNSLTVINWWGLFPYLYELVGDISLPV